MNVGDSDDSAAEAYAGHLAPELDHKPLDRHLLNRFAEETRSRGLDMPSAALAGLVAFYSIVHFDSDELHGVMQELRRVLAPGGLALISFHIGEDVVHVDELFGARVDLDFRFHLPDRVVADMRAAQLAVIERTEREPYEGVEYQSRRCYLLARAV